MEQFLPSEDIISGATYQINANFVTKLGEHHLCLIIPMNLFNDQYAIERFLQVLESKDEMNIGQFYLELVSNINEPGKILFTSKFLSLESYCQIINNILIRSYNFVKENYKW